MFKKALFSAIIAGLAFAGSANAASIGVNVGATGQEIGTSATAGVVAQNNWNDRTGGGSGLAQVTDDSGTLLATQVSVQTSWSYTTGAGNSDANHTLMNGALDNNGGEMGFTVTNVPYALYDVIIYHEGGSDAGRGGAFFVRDTDSGDAIIATQDSYDVTTFSGTFVDASTVGVGGTGIDSEGNAVNSNYVRFSGLTATNIKIRSLANLIGNPATPRAPIAGMQIVEVPEPSSLALIGLGGLMMIKRRKRA